MLLLLLPTYWFTRPTDDLSCPPLPSSLPDELCLSKYHRDSRWYRARIIDVYPPSEEGAPTEYEVFYVDYGTWRSGRLARFATELGIFYVVHDVVFYHGSHEPKFVSLIFHQVYHRSLAPEWLIFSLLHTFPEQIMMGKSSYDLTSVVRQPLGDNGVSDVVPSHCQVTRSACWSLASSR